MFHYKLTAIFLYNYKENDWGEREREKKRAEDYE